MCKATGLSDMKGCRRLKLHKELIREAAKKTRRHKLRYDDSDFSQDMILNTIARIVSRQQVRLAAFMIDHHKLAKEHLRLGEGRVSFVNFPRFSDLICDFRTRCVSDQIRDVERSDRRCSVHKSARSRLLQNRLKLGLGSIRDLLLRVLFRVMRLFPHLLIWHRPLGPTGPPFLR